MEFGQRVDAQGNPHQEDCLFPEFGTQSSADRLFVLCDGMGGHSAGEVASATVCEAMGHSALASMEGGDGLFTDDMLQRAIDDAFDALDAKDNGAEKKMGTTMTLLMLHDGGATVAHMGDSRVYQIRPGEDAAHTSILFETEDHSLWGTGGPGYTVPAEFVAEHVHKKGALAAARRGDAANPYKESSGSQFYIVHDGNACFHLNGDYSVFGETVDGFDVIDKIASVDVDYRDCPLVPVKIVKVLPVEL